MDQLKLPLKRHEYVLYQVIHPLPLFLSKLCPTRRTLRKDKRKIGANKNVIHTHIHTQAEEKEEATEPFLFLRPFVALEESLEMFLFYPPE